MVIFETRRNDMTRRRDLMCEDIFECAHKPEIPISDNGEIMYWLCRCGKKIPLPEYQGTGEEGEHQ
jgi:hypothetical protein